MVGFLLVEFVGVEVQVLGVVEFSLVEAGVETVVGASVEDPLAEGVLLLFQGVL